MIYLSIPHPKPVTLTTGPKAQACGVTGCFLTVFDIFSLLIQPCPIDPQIPNGVYRTPDILELWSQDAVQQLGNTKQIPKQAYTWIQKNFYAETFPFYLLFIRWEWRCWGEKDKSNVCFPPPLSSSYKWGAGTSSYKYPLILLRSNMGSTNYMQISSSVSPCTLHTEQPTLCLPACCLWDCLPYLPFPKLLATEDPLPFSKV